MNQQELIDRYKKRIRFTELKDELYKWESIEAYSGRPDLDVQDLSDEINAIDYSNLMYPMAKAVLKQLANESPVELRKALQDLFDERLDLQERIKRYSGETLRMYRALGETNSHHQDERTISALLTLKYPERYTFYKNSFYTKFCKLLGVAHAKTNEKLPHYLELIATFIEDHIHNDGELIRLVQQYIPVYDGMNHLLLAQDILYQVLDSDTNEKDDEDDESTIKQVLSQYTYKEVQSYLSLLDKIIAHGNLSSGDGRLLFTLAESRFNFSIGQRYVAVLYNPKQRDKEALCNVISISPFGKRSEEFDKKTPLAYFNRLDQIDLSSTEMNAVFAAVDQELSRTRKSGFRKHNHEDLERFVFDLAYRYEILTELFSEHQKPKPMDDLNVIMYGPPGTGKTYNTIDKAVQIIDGESKDHESNKGRFDELVSSGQIVFCTFHQSMTYEDFVEGIKPKTIDGNVIYEVEPGIFKKICANAKSAQRAKSNFEQAYKRLLNEIQNAGGSMVIETLVQAREYTIYENSKGNIKFHSNTEKAYEAVVRKDYIEHYLKTGEALDWPSYLKPIAQRLIDKHGYSESDQETNKKFVLVIDEINRGNVSQIFGELITLIEPDKREGMDNALKVMLPYSKEAFSVPPNLFIIGTMNTADRSVEALDTALRRRFSFVEMPPRPELLSPGACFWRLLWKYEKVDWEHKDYKHKEKLLLDFLGASKRIWEERYDQWVRMSKEGRSESQWKLFPASEFNGSNLQVLLEIINKRIEKLLDKDHLIGHSYLMSVYTMDDLVEVFYNMILPLLNEYFFGDIAKIGLVLGKGFFSEIPQRNAKAEANLFAEFDHEAKEDLLQRAVFKFKTKEELTKDFQATIDLLLGKGN